MSRENNSDSLIQVRRKRADWIVDLVEAQNVAEAWEDKHRILLVVGSEYRYSKLLLAYLILIMQTRRRTLSLRYCMTELSPTP